MPDRCEQAKEATENSMNRLNKHVWFLLYTESSSPVQQLTATVTV